MKTDSLVVGLALFAMFFGAGSLIFPPYLGMVSGPQWFAGFLSFFLSDIGLAFAAIVAMVMYDGRIEEVTGRVGRAPSLLINTATVLCIGPFFAVPRTGATAFEMAVRPLFDDAGLLIFSILYFAVVFVLTVRPARVVDIVGKALTPLMLILLLLLIIMGAVHPIAPISEAPQQGNVVANGIIAGYQALDVFASLAFAIIIIQAVNLRGFENDHKGRVRVVTGACIIAGIALFVVYGGITYLGATVSTLYGPEVNQAELIVIIANLLLGKTGATVLGIVVALACLTTAIGVTSACAAYFQQISRGKIRYEVSVTVIVVFSIVVCNFGLSMIIALAVPVLSFLYPIVLTLIFTSFFKKWIKSDNTIKGAVLGAGIVSLFTVLASFGITFFPIERMPLYGPGLNWILPAVLCGLIGSRFSKKALVRGD